MREFLTRRLGPWPLWLWFAVFVLGVSVFIVWRKRKAGASTAANSDASNAPNLTQQSAQLYPWTTDVFVNVPQTVPDPTSDPRAPYNTGINPHGQPAPYPGTYTPPVVTGLPPDVPTPQRTTSITYPVVSGDTLYAIARKFGISESALYNYNKSTIEATAKQHGFSSSDNGHWIWPKEVLTIPVG